MQNWSREINLHDQVTCLVDYEYWECNILFVKFRNTHLPHLP